jgi:hypothetical protein
MTKDESSKELADEWATGYGLLATGRLLVVSIAVAAAGDLSGPKPVACSL